MHTLVLDGKLFIAPIGDNVQKVLDVGTGTGKSLSLSIYPCCFKLHGRAQDVNNTMTD